MTDTIQRYGIGTVVKISGIKKPLMISGYLVVNSKEKKKIWDYSAVQYPLGVYKSEENIAFDHESIEEVLAIGYQDKSAIEFMQIVNKKANEILDLDGANKNLTEELNNDTEGREENV